MLRTAAALQSVIESWIVGETRAGRKASRGIRRQHTELQVSPQIVIPSPKIVFRELCGEKNGSKRPIFCKLARNFLKRSLQVCSRGPSWGSCTTPYEDLGGPWAHNGDPKTPKRPENTSPKGPQAGPREAQEGSRDHF